MHVDDARHPDGVPDLTLIRDPEKIWPDPLDCPDYPFFVSGRPFGKPRADRFDAEADLEELRNVLHPGGVVLRVPTPDEVEQAFNEHFEPIVPGEDGGQQQVFQALGFVGYRKTYQSQMAGKIVKAVHIRGYLRKLEVEEAAAQESSNKKHRDRLNARVSEFKKTLERYSVEFEKLSEAAARHQRWLDDKKAWERVTDMRGHLERNQIGAREAAIELGVDLPDLPSWAIRK